MTRNNGPPESAGTLEPVPAEAPEVSVRWLSVHRLVARLRDAPPFYVCPARDVEGQLDGADRIIAEAVQAAIGEGPPKSVRGFRAIPPVVTDIATIDADARASNWLVRNVLDRNRVAVLYGAPSSFKTFVALDVALRIATGREVWERDTRHSPVVYFSGECYEEVCGRVVGWLDAAGEFGLGGFGLCATTPDLTDGRSLDDAIAACRPMAPGLVVIDTQSTATPGIEENAAGEMAAALGEARRLATDLGAAVLLVHHTTKGGQTERGSGAVRANVDTMLRCERVGGEPLRAKLTHDKSRGRTIDPVVLDLATVSLPGVDAAGDPREPVLRVAGIAAAAHECSGAGWALARVTQPPFPTGLECPTSAQAEVLLALFELGSATRKELDDTVRERNPTRKAKGAHRAIRELRTRGWVDPPGGDIVRPQAVFGLSALAQVHLDASLADHLGSAHECP